MGNIWLCQGSSRVWGGEPGSYPAKPVPSAIDLVHRSCTGIYGRARNNAFRDLFIARRRGTNIYAYPYSYPFFHTLVLIPRFHTPVSFPFCFCTRPACPIPVCFIPVSYPLHTRFIPPCPATCCRSFGPLCCVHTLCSYPVSICFQTLCFHTLFPNPVFIPCGGYENLWRVIAAP